ncbi:MAG: hypothetical protein ACPGCO_08420 [Flavobacteriaceae bacterium]
MATFGFSTNNVFELSAASIPVEEACDFSSPTLFFGKLKKVKGEFNLQNWLKKQKVDSVAFSVSFNNIGSPISARCLASGKSIALWMPASASMSRLIDLSIKKNRADHTNFINKPKDLFDWQATKDELATCYPIGADNPVCRINGSTALDFKESALHAAYFLKKSEYESSSEFEQRKRKLIDGYSVGHWTISDPLGGWDADKQAIKLQWRDRRIRSYLDFSQYVATNAFGAETNVHKKEGIEFLANVSVPESLDYLESGGDATFAPDAWLPFDSEKLRSREGKLVKLIRVNVSGEDYTITHDRTRPTRYNTFDRDVTTVTYQAELTDVLIVDKSTDEILFELKPRSSDELARKNWVVMPEKLKKCAWLTKDFLGNYLPGMTWDGNILSGTLIKEKCKERVVFLNGAGQGRMVSLQGILATLKTGSQGSKGDLIRISYNQGPR